MEVTSSNPLFSASKPLERTDLIKLLPYRHNIKNALKLATKKGAEISVSNNLVTIKKGNNAITLDLNKTTPSKTLQHFRKPSEQLEFNKNIGELANKILLAKPPSAISSYGLAEEEFQLFKEFYVNNKADLDALPEPKFIKKGEGMPPLPRSVVYVPEGPKKGLYILLKTHGGVEEVGIGAFNRATIALHLDTGDKKVFRNAKESDISESEFETNKITSDFPEHFAAGIPVRYSGPWRPRSIKGINREKNLPLAEKQKLPREENVPKVGFIMDLLPGGELFDILADNQLTYKQQVGIAREYAWSLAKLHELGFVHFDQKLENTLLTEDLHPRIADFGFTKAIGAKQGFCGTPGFVSPEVVRVGLYKEEYFADPKADIWSLGCVLADIFGTTWWENNGQTKGRWARLLDKDTLEAIKEQVLPGRSDIHGHNFIIDSCLQLEPSTRPDAIVIAKLLDDLYSTI